MVRASEATFVSEQAKRSLRKPAKAKQANKLRKPAKAKQAKQKNKLANKQVKHIEQAKLKPYHGK